MPEPLSNHRGQHNGEYPRSRAGAADQRPHPDPCTAGCGHDVCGQPRHLASFPVLSSPLTPHRVPRRHDRRQSSSPTRNNTSSSDHDSGSSTRPRSRQKDHPVRTHPQDSRAHPQGCCCCDQHLGVECEEDVDEEEAKQNLADDEGISSSDDNDEGSSGRSRRHHVTKGRQVNGRDAHRGSPSIVDDCEWPPPRGSMINSLLEGHFTRLATPPHSRRLSTPPHRPPPAPSKTRHQDYGNLSNTKLDTNTHSSGNSTSSCLVGVDLETGIAAGRKSRKVDNGKMEGCSGRCNTHPIRDHSQERNRRDGSVEGFYSGSSYCCRYSSAFSSGCALNHSGDEGLSGDGASLFLCDNSRYGGGEGGGSSHHRHSYHEGVVSSEGGRRQMRAGAWEKCLPSPAEGGCTCSRCSLPNGGDLPSTCCVRHPMLGLTCGSTKCPGPTRPHPLSGRCLGPADGLYSRGDPDGRRCDQKERHSSGRRSFEREDGNEADEEESRRDGAGCLGCSGQKGWHQGAADARVRSLQQQHNSLELQVSVLAEQVAAQSEKIQDLEAQLHAKNRLLLETEDKLHKEVMAVSGLETQRLQLLSELSTLQLRQASSQHGARLPHLQLSPLLAEFTAGSPGSISTLSTTNALQLYDNNANNTSNGSSGGAETTKISAPRTPPPSFNRQVDPLLQSLRTTRSASTSTRPSPSTHHHHHTLNGRHDASDGGPLNGGGASNTLPYSTSGAATPKATLFGVGGKAETEKQGDVPPDRLPHSPSLTRDDRSRSIQHPLASEDRQNYGPADGQPGGASPYNNYGHPSPSTSAGDNSRKSPTNLKTLSSGNLHNIHNLQQYSSDQQQPVTSPITSHKPTTIKKIFTRLRRSSSGHLRGSEGAGDRGGVRVGEDQQLRRGGVRATATARLGWAPQTPSWTEPNVPFLTWTTPDCERWLESLGLSQYGAALRCWQASSGNHLSRATPSQLDKQLGVRHPLHRKKLQLAIAARMGVEGSLGRESPGNHIESAALSSVWVSQWLDDVGLPQYKEAFHEARIDPRVLDVLTWDDLAFLKINSLLHAISLKRGVQVLREHNFDSSSLIRRSGTTPSPPTDNNDNNNRSLNGNSSSSDAEDACLWTNHRVMEWLRTVDLSEYAPNLRGSGVHGALLVYEVRFNAEVLAALLSIPSSKTLLRRHLNTHFKELVGREVVLEKRQVEDTPGYSPLTTATKIKPNKRSQFSLKRRSSSKSRGGHTLEFDDLLCPLEERPPRAAVQRRALENSPETRLC